MRGNRNIQAPISRKSLKLEEVKHNFETFKISFVSYKLSTQSFIWLLAVAWRIVKCTLVVKKVDSNYYSYASYPSFIHGDENIGLYRAHPVIYFSADKYSALLYDILIVKRSNILVNVLIRIVKRLYSFSHLISGDVKYSTITYLDIKIAT